jgi:hypothetical protein
LIRSGRYMQIWRCCNVAQVHHFPFFVKYIILLRA